jgi:hypothetical protein
MNASRIHKKGRLAARFKRLRKIPLRSLVSPLDLPVTAPCLLGSGYASCPARTSLLLSFASLLCLCRVWRVRRVDGVSRMNRVARLQTQKLCTTQELHNTLVLFIVKNALPLMLSLNALCFSSCFSHSCLSLHRTTHHNTTHIC